MGLKTRQLVLSIFIMIMLPNPIKTFENIGYVGLLCLVISLVYAIYLAVNSLKPDEQPQDAEKQFQEVVEWQDKTFPSITTVSTLYHLKEEVEELRIDIINGDPKKRIELADCFILLYGVARKEGMSFDDIMKAIDEKMAINKARKWGEPKENGVINHVKSENSEYRYEIYIDSERPDFIEMTGWYPIATNAIPKNKTIEEYLRSGLLRIKMK